MIRPQPNAADIVEAERFVAETFDADPAMTDLHRATHRESWLRYSAVAEMMKRQAAEHRAKAGSQPVKRRAA